ncbi:MAG: hypothetical protein JEZ07_07120 [Phycisphaerae bacterium]|nr:hypothetical protein [Phycisphaerae bacterium]
MRSKNTSGISIIELVIIIAVIGIISAMAVPRMSSAGNFDYETELKKDLAIFRNAIDLYYSEHQDRFPGEVSDGKYQANSSDAFVAQLTLFSDINGHTSVQRDENYVYGPYLRNGIPVLPVGDNAGKSTVKIISEPIPPKADLQTSVGWVFNVNTGQIIPNAQGCGSDGVSYISY